MAGAGRPSPALSKAEIQELRVELRRKDREIATLQKVIDSRASKLVCRMCGSELDPDEFYTCTDPRIKTGVTSVCRRCTDGIALRVDPDGNAHTPTRNSVIEALRYLDFPFITAEWESSVIDARSGLNKNPWAAYMRRIHNRAYFGLTFANSDFFNIPREKPNEEVEAEKRKEREQQDIFLDCERNRADILRMLSYDPFENEDEADKPLLYSQLLGLLDSDEDASDDMMRVSSAITIVRTFLQQAKLDDATAKLMGDYNQINNNIGSIKSMQDSKKAMTATIKDLAVESGISLKTSKGSKKGENTWTGKVKKIKDLNLREGEVNGYDLATCRGMRQVMDASNRSLIDQLKLDESEYGEIIAEQREMVVNAIRERDKYKEINRIILRENLDLRDTLKERGLLTSDNLVPLDDLYSPFSAIEKEEEAVEEEEQEDDGS